MYTVLSISGCDVSARLRGLSLVVVSGGYSLVAVHRLIVVAFLVEYGLLGMWASAVAAHGLSRCGSWALGHRLNSCGAPRGQLLRGM